MLKCVEDIEHFRFTGDQTMIVRFRRRLKFIQALRLSLIVFIFLFLLFIFTSTSLKAGLISQSTPIRIGITSVILDQQIQFLQRWKLYLEARLKQPVKFVQRDNYAKITSHLLKGELDFGWICGYPYVQYKSNLELLVVPLYEGKPLYRSYLIVSSTDLSTDSFLDLKNTVFAYSDPDSNSGYLYARYSLAKANIDVQSYFKKTFFTWQHKNTVEAVAVGLAQAGVVDGYIWETMKKQQHSFIAKTRVAHKSAAFAFPPLVVTKNVPNQLKNALQNILLSMDKDAQGRRLLEQLNIDGFVRGSTQLYDDILNMHLFMEKNKHVAS